MSSAAGVYLGTVVPAAWGLEFMLTLTFIAIVVPMLTDRPLVVAAAAASAVSVAAASLPMRVGLLAGAAAGIVAGLAAERRGPADRRGTMDPRGAAEQRGA
jgi:predicted branched-subunit amino acid permease